MEFVEMGSLAEFCEVKDFAKYTTPKDLLTIMIDAMMGCVRLHSYPVLHGDVKPSNILITQNLRGKICDFGLSTIMHREKITGIPLHFITF
jgi:serine/threonine protein kinase